MPRPRRNPPILRDPLAQLSDRFLNRRARRELRSMVDPLVAEQTRRITASAEAGSRNIEGVTGRLAEGLAAYPERTRAIYDRSIADQGALDTAAADRLNAAGAAQGEEMRKRLELSGSPMASALVGEVQGVGAGAGSAQFGRGAAERSALIAQRAAAEEYGTKLPELARLSGAQQVGELRAGRQRDLADALGEIRSQMPGLAAGLVEKDRRLEFEKAALLRGLGLDYAKLDEEARQFARSQAERERAARRRESQNATNEAGRNRRADQSEAGRNRRAKAAAARQGRTYNENLSRQRGYAVDSRGRPILDDSGKRIPYDPSKADKGSGNGRSWSP